MKCYNSLLSFKSKRLVGGMPEKTVLIDLSGTLHIGNTVTPGAVESLERLRKSSAIRLKFVTNTTKESRNNLYNRLIKLGFNIEKNEIISSLWAARELIEKEQLKPYYLVDDEAIEDFEGLAGWKEDECNCVVVGLAPDKFNQQNLNAAFRILTCNRPTNKLIAIHEAKYYRTEDGLLSLGPGLFVKALEYASGCKSTVVGKPSLDFFRLATLPSTDMTNVYMIGDDVKQDIDGAQKVGIKGYLVKTGKYQPDDENKISPAPYRTVSTFAEAINDILQS